MEYVKLGPTGADVSRLCIGCMGYADAARGKHPWAVDEATSRVFLKEAIARGINFFDTANAYSDGTSEEILGRAVADYGNRSELVIATKVNRPMRPGPNGAGSSRKAIMYEIDASLKRLGTDYIDLYQIHRWDPTTPIEETLEALHDIVKAGKALYIGASSMYAWQFSKAQYVAERNGWTQFVTMQNHYNLLYREEEREMLPLCADLRAGVLPWSPLARGRLTRDWDSTSTRFETDGVGKVLYPNVDRPIVEAVACIAERRGVSRAQIALAWVIRNPLVTAPVIGVMKSHHLDDAIASLEIVLTDDEVAALEGPYTPRGISAVGQTK